MVAVARDERALAVGREHDVSWARVLLADRHLAGRRHGRAVDREHGNRALGAIGHQGQRAGLVDGYAGGALAGLQRGERSWVPARSLGADSDGRLRRRVTRLGFSGDRSMTVSLSSGICLVGSAGSICIELATSAMSSFGDTATLVGGPTTLLGTSISASTLGGVALQIDEGHGVGRRALLYLRLAVDELDLGVVGRDGDFGVGRRGRARHQQGCQDASPGPIPHADLPDHVSAPQCAPLALARADGVRSLSPGAGQNQRSTKRPLRARPRSSTGSAGLTLGGDRAP